MKSKSERRDVATEITEQVVAELERGVAPWVKPWSEGAGALRLPTNARSGKTYRGVNVVLLWMAAEKAGYSDSRWLTFKQAQELGGHVKKGEKGTGIVFWHFSKVAEKGGAEASEVIGEEKGARRVAFCRFYTVFNVAQCEGLDIEASAAVASAEPGAAERIAARVGAQVLSGQRGAWFSPSRDVIGMPARELFESPEAYESTLLHELTHWTGHESRLARTFGKRFGDGAYAFEELVAELGSAFLCAELGIVGRLQHTEYLGHWASVLKADRHAIFTAARHAQDAMGLLLGDDAAEVDEADAAA